MVYQKALRVFLVLVVLNLLGSVGIVIYRGHYSLPELLNGAIYCGLFFLAVGTLVVIGAGQGTGQWNEPGNRSGARDSGLVRIIDGMDMLSGQELGVVISVAGLAWAGLFMGFYYWLIPSAS